MEGIQIVDRSRRAVTHLGDVVGWDRLKDVLRTPGSRLCKDAYIASIQKAGDVPLYDRDVIDSYKREHFKHLRINILATISELREGIALLYVTHRTCQIVRDLIDQDCPMFTVSAKENFVGVPYFRFRLCDSELFGVVE